MKVVLQQAYGLGISGVFLAMGILVMLLVACIGWIFRRRNCVRPTYICSRVIAPLQYLFTTATTFAAIMVGSAMGLWSVWITFVIGALFPLASFLHYYRKRCDIIRTFQVQDYDDEMCPENAPMIYPLMREKHIKHNYLVSLWKGNKSRPFLLISMIVICFCTSGFFTFASDGLCVAVRPIQISTRFTRMLQGDACAEHSVCHTYFTLPEDPSTSIIVNYHSRHRPISASVTYGLVNSTVSRTVEARWQEMDLEVTRFVFWADVEGLVPNTAYWFRPSYTTADEIFVRGDTRMIRTVPDSGNVTFVTGGDMETDESGFLISRLAASKEPYFAMLGGDIAYANGFKQCYRRWDDWFSAWSKYARTPSGFDLPISLALGNHEAGGDHGSRESIPFFLDYFPQRLGLQHTQPKERPIFHSHSMGNHSTMMVLDSGIVESMTGHQLRWMENHLNSTNATNTFAIYHYSLYPSVPSEVMIDTESRQAWVDLFSKYNLTIGFENHYHVFKRSKTVKHDKEVASPSEGTTFFGDGAWGVTSTNPFLNGNSWFIKSVARTPHFYLVSTSESMVTVDAINSDDQIFDSFVLKR